MFSMIYLWLIGAVVLAGADHSSRHDLPAHYCCSRIGRLYLCRDRSRDTVSAARVCRLCHCRLCLSVLSEKEKLRKHGCRPFAAHQRRTLRRSQGMERKRQSSSFLSRNRLGCKPEKGSPMVPGLWEIVGMSGNTLITNSNRRNNVKQRRVRRIHHGAGSFCRHLHCKIGSRRSSAGSLGRRTIRKISHRASAGPEFHHSDYRSRCLSPDAQRNSDGHIEPKSALPKTTLSCRWTASSTFRSPIRNLPATERPTL